MPADTLPPEVRRDLDAMDAAVAGRTHEGGDAVLADLAALLAADRPEPDPRWARRLDTRAAQGFPRRRRRLRVPRVWLAPAAGVAACAALILVVGLAAHHSPGSDSSSSAGAGGGGGGVSSSAAESQAAPAPLARSRKVERSASMRLGAPRRDLDEVAAGVSRVATQVGGFVASSNLSSRDGGDLELRVPSGRLDDAIARLSRLGHVRDLQRSTLDITAQSVSARTRVADLKAERASLRRQLAAATTLTETDRLKARLRVVDRRLEAARAAAQRISRRAALASLTVEIEPERSAATGGAWTPGDAWHDALRVLEIAAGIALIALAVTLPLAVFGLPAWLASRRVTRRRRERALDLA
jgi:uncharacterized protein DUF4349